MNLIEPYVAKNNIRKELSIAFIVYMFVSLLFFRDIFTKIYIDTGGDNYFSFYSWNVFFKNCIANGIFPLWNPFVLCGQPYHLESVSNFSISNILLFFFNVNTAWNIKMFFSMVLSGWLMFILLRIRLKLHSAAALTGGIIFMMLIPNVADSTMFFIPLIFIAAGAWLGSKKTSRMVLLAFVIFFYFLNTNPQFVLYTCLLAYAYIFVAFLKESGNRNIKDIILCALRASVPFVIACGLSSVRIIPMLEMLRISHRGAMTSFSYMLSPTHLINVLYPKFYLSHAHPELSFFPERISNGITAFLFGPGRVRLMDGPYIGILPFLLALVMITKKNKNFEEKFFAYASIAVLGYVILNSALFVLIRYISPVNMMPFINRSYVVYDFSMSILAAFAVNHLLSRKRSDMSGTGSFLNIFYAVVAFLALVKVSISIAMSIFEKDIMAVLTKNALTYILKQPFYKASVFFYDNRLKDFLEFLRSWANPFDAYFLLPTIILIISIVVIQSRIRDRIGKNVFIGLSVALIFFDLSGHFKVPVCSYDEVVAPYKSADFIKKQPGIFRVMPLLQYYDPKNPSPADAKTFLRPESNMSYGIMTPEGYRSLYPDRYADIMGLLAMQPAQEFKAKVGEFNNIDDRIASLLNIKYVVTLKNREPGNNYKLIYEDGIHSIFLNRHALERAFMVYYTAVIKEKKEVLRAISSPEIDLSKVVILEEDVAGLAPHKSIEESIVLIKEYGPNSVVIDVNSAREGFLILLDTYYSGWKAYIDDKPAKIYRADYVFRAVRVGPGRHQVRFLYRPYSLKLGALISLTFLCPCVLLLLRRKIC